MSKLEALKKAVEVLKGQTNLAKACGNDVKQQHVYNWLNRSGGLPPAYGMLVEIATTQAGDAVKASDLCPGFFPAADD